MNNRIIKFRAWDKYLRQYINNIEFLSNGYFSSDGCPVFLMEGKSDDYQNLEESFENNFILQQFTGLLDKNGKEIYEGDIIQLDGAPYRWEVLWDKWRWCVVSPDFNSNIQGFTAAIYDRAIVIGNIFENPELIK